MHQHYRTRIPRHVPFSGRQTEGQLANTCISKVLSGFFQRSPQLQVDLCTAVARRLFVGSSLAFRKDQPQQRATGCRRHPSYREKKDQGFPQVSYNNGHSFPCKKDKHADPLRSEHNTVRIPAPETCVRQHPLDPYDSKSKLLRQHDSCSLQIVLRSYPQVTAPNLITSPRGGSTVCFAQEYRANTLGVGNLPRNSRSMVKPRHFTTNSRCWLDNLKANRSARTRQRLSPHHKGLSAPGATLMGSTLIHAGRGAFTLKACKLASSPITQSPSASSLTSTQKQDAMIALVCSIRPYVNLIPRMYSNICYRPRRCTRLSERDVIAAELFVMTWTNISGAQVSLWSSAECGKFWRYRQAHCLNGSLRPNRMSWSSIDPQEKSRRQPLSYKARWDTRSNIQPLSKRFVASPPLTEARLSHCSQYSRSNVCQSSRTQCVPGLSMTSHGSNKIQSSYGHASAPSKCVDILHPDPLESESMDWLQHVPMDVDEEGVAPYQCDATATHFAASANSSDRGQVRPTEGGGCIISDIVGPIKLRRGWDKICKITSQGAIRVIPPTLRHRMAAARAITKPRHSTDGFFHKTGAENVAGACDSHPKSSRDRAYNMRLSVISRQWQQPKGMPERWQASAGTGENPFRETTCLLVTIMRLQLWPVWLSQTDPVHLICMQWTEHLAKPVGLDQQRRPLHSNRKDQNLYRLVGVGSFKDIVLLLAAAKEVTELHASVKHMVLLA